MQSFAPHKKGTLYMYMYIHVVRITCGIKCMCAHTSTAASFLCSKNLKKTASRRKVSSPTTSSHGSKD